MKYGFKINQIIYLVFLAALLSSCSYPSVRSIDSSGVIASHTLLRERGTTKSMVIDEYGEPDFVSKKDNIYIYIIKQYAYDMCIVYHMILQFDDEDVLVKSSFVCVN